MTLDATLAKIIDAVPYVIFLWMWVMSERSRADRLEKVALESKDKHIQHMEDKHPVNTDE